LCAIPVTLLAQSREKKTLVGREDIGGWRTTTASIEPHDFWRGRQLHHNAQYETARRSAVSWLCGRAGTGYGRWVQTGDGEFKLTFYSILWKEGVVNGYQRVRSTMILSDSGNEFTADKVQIDFLDTNWKVVSSDIDEVTGTRLETP
jgi:hypothetical protein